MGSRMCTLSVEEVNATTLATTSLALFPGSLPSVATHVVWKEPIARNEVAMYTFIVVMQLLDTCFSIPCILF